MLDEKFWQRFAEKVRLGATPRGMASPCWLWVGAIDRYGYGVVRLGTKMVKAHRTMYQGMKGGIPNGLVIDHLCRVRCCVQPEHLQPVSAQENLRRGREARRRA